MAGGKGPEIHPQTDALWQAATLLWSALPNATGAAAAAWNYTQVLAESAYSLVVAGGSMRGFKDGAQVFQCSGPSCIP